MVTWTRGRHLVKAGVGIPHLNRRAFDDNTNALGTYTFGPTLAADGVTVLQTALAELRRQPSLRLLAEHRRHPLHLSPAGDGRLHPGPVQDQRPLLHHARPALRLAELPGHAPPRLFTARLLRLGARSGLQGRGARRRRHLLRPLRLRPAARPRSLRKCAAAAPSVSRSTPPPLPGTGCVPITDCVTVAAQPRSPGAACARRQNSLPDSIRPFHRASAWARRPPASSASTPCAASMSSAPSTSTRPRRESGYTLRPNPAYGRIRQMQPAGFFEGSGLDISYRGELNKYFTGFGRYTWSHYESNTGGIGWFPQNQFAPNDEWSNAGFDRRQRLGMYAMFNPKSVFNLSTGIFANTGTPWTDSHRHRRLRRRPLQHPPRRRRRATLRPCPPTSTSTCAGATTSPSPPTRATTPRASASPPAPSTCSTTRTRPASTPSNLRLPSARSPPSTRPAASSSAMRFEF